MAPNVFRNCVELRDYLRRFANIAGEVVPYDTNRAVDDGDPAWQFITTRDCKDYKFLTKGSEWSDGMRRLKIHCKSR